MIKKSNNATKITKIAGLVLGATMSAAAYCHTAWAWTQIGLPAVGTSSQSKHFGGAQQILTTANPLLAVAPDINGVKILTANSTANGGWTSSLIDTVQFEGAKLLSENMVVAWNRYIEPIFYVKNGGVWQKQGGTGRWPFTKGWPMAVTRLPSGNVGMLISEAQAGKIVEGPLYYIKYNGSNVWGNKVLLTNGMVGDASIIKHASGLITVVWSERDPNYVPSKAGWSGWKIMLSNSSDEGATWTPAMTVASRIIAPERQEAASSLAAAAAGNNQIALLFSGWSANAFNQLWGKVVDVNSGVGSGMMILPTEGDMVYSPTLAVLNDGSWIAAWQQKRGTDMEILAAERSANGVWGGSINISSDPFFIDRDPLIAANGNGKLEILYTTSKIAGGQEELTLTEGTIADPVLDTDGDGMPDWAESGIDNDGDGVDDTYSSACASWEETDGVFSISTDYGRLEQVQVTDWRNINASNPNILAPLSAAISFRIAGLPVGGSATVNIKTPYSLSGITPRWMKWTKHGTWQETPAPTANNSTNNGIVITLTDGAAGDEDGTANGTILDPGIVTGASDIGNRTGQVANGATGGGGHGGCILGSYGNTIGIFIQASILLTLVSMITISNRRKTQ